MFIAYIKQRGYMDKIELSKLESFYNKYKNRNITFTKETTRKIGLIQKDIKINVGIFKFNCAVLNSSMEDITIIAKLDGYLKEMVNARKHIASLEMKFFDNFYKETSVFKIYGKIYDIDPYSNYGDVFTINIKITRKFPMELIYKYYDYFSFLSTENLSKTIEGMFFINGTRKKCIPRNLTKENLSIEVDSNTPERYIGQKAIVVIKNLSSGDVYEIIGKTDYNYIQSNEKLNVKLNYSHLQQGPRFEHSFECLSSILNHGFQTANLTI